MDIKKFIMMLATTASITANASEANDTVVINNADKVTIMTSDTVQRVTVLGKEGEQTFVYDESVPLNKWKMKKKKGSNKLKCWDFDFAVGVGTPTNAPDDLSFAPFKSMEWLFGLRYAYTPKKASQSYSVGLWCDWRSYGTSDKYFIKDKFGIIGSENAVVLSGYPPKTSSKSSSINIFSLSVPILFTQRFGQQGGFKVTLGPVVNFNVHGRINTSYEVDEVIYSEKTKGIEYRSLTIDFMGMASYRGIGIYCKYSPMSVLKKDKGPEFHALTFGLFI
jgi:hypothetical protein